MCTGPKDSVKFYGSRKECKVRSGGRGLWSTVGSLGCFGDCSFCSRQSRHLICFVTRAPWVLAYKNRLQTVRTVAGWPEKLL